MLGHNKDANPGFREKLHSMRGGENITSSFTNGLRQNSFKDTVNSKLGLHADKSYAEPHRGVPQRLKNGGMADGGDTSMLNRGEKDCHGGNVYKRGGPCNERAPGRPQMAGQFDKRPLHGDSGQTQFTKRPHPADSGQRQFEKRAARAKSGGQMNSRDDDAEHHSWGDFVDGLKGALNVATLGGIDLGGKGPLQDFGRKIGGIREGIANKVAPILGFDEGGNVPSMKKLGRGRRGDKRGVVDVAVDEKAIGGVPKIRHGQMKARDMA